MFVVISYIIREIWETLISSFVSNIRFVFPSPYLISPAFIFQLLPILSPFRSSFHHPSPLDLNNSIIFVLLYLHIFRVFNTCHLFIRIPFLSQLHTRPIVVPLPYLATTGDSINFTCILITAKNSLGFPPSPTNGRRQPRLPPYLNNSWR
jgi:hypothetical protein